MGFFDGLGASIADLWRKPLVKLAAAILGSQLNQYGAREAEDYIAGLDQTDHVWTAAEVAELPVGSRILGVSVGAPGQVNAESMLRRQAEFAERAGRSLAHVARHSGRLQE